MADFFDRLQAAVGDAYRLEEELGGGGMSRVFLGEESRLGRRVVIKVLPPEMAAGVSAERFEREIQLAAKLQHPHIVPVLTAGAADDLLYYVMPYIEGESLRVKLSREGELPVSETLRILRGVLDALAYAHEHGVVHRDIKPDNVLLSGKHAVVTDFGVAKAVSASTGASSLTSLGVALGTPSYMSPEQAAANPQVDHRADIYAVGALAYEMLCGRPPFAGTNPQAVLAAHVTQIPEPCTAHRPAVPPCLNALVMRCLEKHPADRWQRADELGAQLEGMTTPSGGMTPTGTQPVSAVDYEAAARQGHPGRVAVLFGLGSVAVLGLVYAIILLLGLPDWVLFGAVALLAVGLPVMMATGHFERRRVLAQTTGEARPGVPADDGFGGTARRWLTWRRSLLGGGLAFAGLGTVAAGYMAMRALGIGPVGTLMATGALEARDRLIVADFDNRTGDSTLGPSVTEAFRIDLAQSPVLRLMEVADVAPALERMGRDPASPLDRETALEVAEREGIKGVVAGEIGPVGEGFVLSARVVSAADGAQLLALRESADDAGELIAAIDRLSARLRERVGESLRTIRANQPLERVSTASLDALRKYSQGVQAFNLGDYDRAIPLLEEAIAADTAFAMAYRKLAAVLNNTNADQSSHQAAATNAYRYRERLPDLERYLATAYYYDAVEYDPARVRTSYLNALEIQPENLPALNNLALLHNQLREWEEAERYALRAMEVAVAGPPLGNALEAQVRQGAFDRADSTLRRFEAAAPDHPAAAFQRARLTAAQRDFPAAEARFLELRERFAARRLQRTGADFNLWALNQTQGKLENAERYMRELVAFAEEEDQGDDYLNRVMNLAWIDVLLRGDPGHGESRVTEAVSRYPLETMDPLDRPYLDLADLYAEVGRPERARQLVGEYEGEIEERLRRDNADDLLDTKGVIALAEGRYDDAVGLLRGALEADHCSACGSLELARAYEGAGQTDSAIVEYERMVSTTFMSRIFRDAFALAASYRRLGELYEERGDRDKAVENYNAFVDVWRDADPELQPQVAEVRGRIARLVGERR